MTPFALGQRRYQQAVMAQLRLTYGKHGRPAYPSYRKAWADTTARTVVGALLLAAVSIAWLVVLW